MHTLKLTRTHKVGNLCRYLSLIDCRRGFARPRRSVQYYGKFPTLIFISGLPVRLHPYNTITRSIRLEEIYTNIIILTLLEKWSQTGLWPKFLHSIFPVALTGSC